MAKNTATETKAVILKEKDQPTAPMQVLRTEEKKEQQPQPEQKPGSPNEKENAMPEPTTEPAAPAPVAPTAEPVKKEVSVHDILAKVNELNGLNKKYTYLRDIKNQLSNFTLGTSGLADSLNMRDANGNQFSTNNSEIIGKILRLLKSEVNLKIEETEEELRAAL